MPITLHHTHLLAIAACLFAGQACAQVYQCKDANGKNVFSQTPCSAQGGSGEKMLMTAPARPAAAAPAPEGVPFKGEPGVLYGNGKSGAPAPKDWAAENAAANARANAAPTGSANTPWPPLRKTTAATAPKSDQQIVAECEAGRGARCGSAGEIAQRRIEQRQLTPAEQRQQQDAVAARRQRQLEESMNRR